MKPSGERGGVGDSALWKGRGGGEGMVVVC